MMKLSQALTVQTTLVLVEQEHHGFLAELRNHVHGGELLQVLQTQRCQQLLLNASV